MRSAARGEVSEGVVAPVIAQSLFDQVAVLDVMVDGHQFDGGDAEAAKVLDGGLGAQSRIGAAELLGHAGQAAG